MYCFGYYYHFPHGTLMDAQVVVLMMNGLFFFKEVDKNLIPLEKRLLSNNYYDLSMPILCYSTGTSISELYFLQDFPITNDKNNDGFTFYVDDYLRRSILKYKNQPFIDNYISDDKDIRFAHLVEELAGAKKRISVLSQTVSYITPDVSRPIERITKELIHLVDSYDLKDILSSLTVTVKDHYRSRPGRDDSYGIYRTAYLENKNIKTDAYIDKIIGLGENCIYYARAFSSWLRVDAPKVFIGEYTGQVLEDEKERIMASYSKEEHLAYLIFSKVEEKENAQKEINCWKTKINEIQTLIKEGFCVELLPRLARYFTWSPKISTSELLDSINNLVKKNVLNYPVKVVLFSGDLPWYSHNIITEEYTRCKLSRQRLVSKIHAIIDELLQTYNVKIIIGGEKGAEEIAYKYALDKKIEIIDDWGNPSELGTNGLMYRYYKMVNKADIVYLTDYNKSYLFKGFLKAANELNVPVEILSDD